MSPPRRPTNPSMAALATPFEEVSNPGFDLPPAPPKTNTWVTLIGQLGFPIVAFGVVVWLGVGYHRDTRAEMTSQRQAYVEQVDKLVRAQREDRDALIRALEKQYSVLEAIKDQLRNRPR